MVIARLVFSGGELRHATKQTAHPMAGTFMPTPPPTFLPAVWLATPQICVTLKKISDTQRPLNAISRSGGASVPVVSMPGCG
jgi:hypothetical protein